jgi:hypothetical protein
MKLMEKQLKSLKAVETGFDTQPPLPTLAERLETISSGQLDDAELAGALGAGADAPEPATAPKARDAQKARARKQELAAHVEAGKWNGQSEWQKCLARARASTLAVEPALRNMDILLKVRGACGERRRSRLRAVRQNQVATIAQHIEEAQLATAADAAALAPLVTQLMSDAGEGAEVRSA